MINYFQLGPYYIDKNSNISWQISQDAHKNQKARTFKRKKQRGVEFSIRARSRNNY